MNHAVQNKEMDKLIPIVNKLQVSGRISEDLVRLWGVFLRGGGGKCRNGVEGGHAKGWKS